MPSPSNNEPDENLINTIVDRVQGRIKPRNVWQHSDSVQFTDEEATNLKLMLVLARWFAGLLGGSVVAIVGLIIALVMAYSDVQQGKTDKKDMKLDIAEMKSTVQSIEKNTNESIKAANNSIAAINNWRARFKYAKDKQGQIYIYPDTEEPQ